MLGTVRALISILLLSLASPALAQDEPIYIHCGTLLAVPGEDPVEDVTVVVRGGVIEAVREGFIEPGNGAIIDLRETFVMPGLFDCHVHLTNELQPMAIRLRRMVAEGPQHGAARGAAYAERTLMAGFTTVRNVGASGGADLALRDVINSGDVVGPRMLCAGETISVTGGHGDRTNGYGRNLLEAIGTGPGVADGVAACREAVRLQVKHGADLIKLTATGGVLSIAATGVDQQFFDDELEAIVQTAHSMGRKVAAHAHGTTGINAALRAGVDSIEHGTYLDEESIRLFKQTGAYLVPTIHAGKYVAEKAGVEGYFPPAIHSKARTVGPQIQDSLGRAYRAGVNIAFGTDCGVGEHGTNYREFVYMVEAGVTEMDALMMATVHAADLCGVSDTLGTIEPGKLADLIAIDGDPLEDIAVLNPEGVGFVMKQGAVYKN